MARHFAYTSDIDAGFFSQDNAVPIVSIDQFKIAKTASTLQEIGKKLSASEVSDEQLYMPSKASTESLSELVAIMMSLREEDTKSLFYIVFKPLTNFSDHKIRVACCIVRDLGGDTLESQLVPNDQPPDPKVVEQQIQRSYEAFRQHCPADGRSTSKIGHYALSVTEQVDFLARAYKSNGFAHIRDPLKDHFEAYDKKVDYTNTLLDLIEDTDDGKSLSGLLRDKIYKQTSFIHDIPIIGELAGFVIDESTDLLGGLTNMIEDGIGEGLRAVDPILRPVLNNVPVLGQLADYAAYGVMELDNLADVTTGDMVNEIRLRI